MLKDIIIEGVDRMGKSSLIDGLMNTLGFFQVIHYEKPKVLGIHYSDAIEKINREDPSAHMDPPALDWDARQSAQKAYQVESFWHMLRMLSQPGRYIMDRAHLGEFVYAPRYRKYSGDYVFDLERQFTNDQNSKFADTTLLVLLTTSDFSFIQDDGLSFDFSKKEEEQEDFKRAFSKSTIKNKLMIDVAGKTSKFEYDADYNSRKVEVGCYRPAEDILNEVLEAYKK